MKKKFFQLLILLFFSSQVLAAKPEENKYSSLLEHEKPSLYWNFNTAPTEVGFANASHDSFIAIPKGNVDQKKLGLSGKAYPDFSTNNQSLQLNRGANYLVVKDVPIESEEGKQTIPESELRFDNGDSITIEAWIKPSTSHSGSYDYIVGKGRTQNSGYPAENQNYALRLDYDKSGALSFLFMDRENPKTKEQKHIHRWTSNNAVPLDNQWHHIALVYSFGEPEKITGYIDGKKTTGKWDLGGATTKAPMVDDDELWIGSSMGGRSTFIGAIDELAIYRKRLSAEEIKKHVNISRVNNFQLALEEAQQNATSDSVQVALIESIQGARSWTLPADHQEIIFETDLFSIQELPKKFSSKGLYTDRKSGQFIHLYSKAQLPQGNIPLALRSLSGARLYIDGELVIDKKSS